jgi:hypothetical protein
MEEGTMEDIRGFTKDLDRLAKAVTRMQARLGAISDERPVEIPSRVPAEPNLFLMRRHLVLAALGIHEKVSRASWSHDRVDAIIFDAWDHLWERNEKTGRLLRYPMRTDLHYNLADSRENPVRGHTRWQHHVDIVVGGHRSAILIMPVQTDSDDPNRRTRGWLPQYVTGEIRGDRNGEFWFYAKEVIPI